MQVDKKMRFSVIISTCNRAEMLKDAIQGIFNQGFADYEIIVSDDASTDATRHVVESFGSAGKIVYLFSDRKLGLSATRNRALKSSRGEYIVLIDDDVILSRNFLEILDGVISSEKVNVLCPVLRDPLTSESFVDLLDNKKRYLGLFDFNYFRGGAHIISRDVISNIGGYDERFGIGAKYRAAEETDYFFRLKKSGEKILYYPDLVVYHTRQTETSFAKAFSYSYGISAMLMKQILSDLCRAHFYIFIVGWRLMTSLARTLQYELFPKTIEAKNKMYQYRYFLKGTISGIADYLRFR